MQLVISNGGRLTKCCVNVTSSVINLLSTRIKKFKQISHYQIEYDLPCRLRQKWITLWCKKGKFTIKSLQLQPEPGPRVGLLGHLVTYSTLTFTKQAVDIPNLSRWILHKDKNDFVKNHFCEHFCSQQKSILLMWALGSQHDGFANCELIAPSMSLIAKLMWAFSAPSIEC